jgi:hypothetical protein
MVFAKVDLRHSKSAAAESLPPGQPGREAVLFQPDEMEEAAFDLLFPSLVRLLRLRTER